MHRDDLEALRARYEALPPDAPERAGLRAEYERLARHRRLPLLDGLRIATPCREPWEDMMGDHRVRFCTRCAKNVYDVSALTRAQALDLIETMEGGCCVRLFRRRDGTVLTADCPDAVARRRRHRFVVAATAVAAVTTALFWTAEPARSRHSMGLGQVDPEVHGAQREGDPPFGGTLAPFHDLTMDDAVQPQGSFMGAISISIPIPP